MSKKSARYKETLISDEDMEKFEAALTVFQQTSPIDVDSEMAINDEGSLITVSIYEWSDGSYHNDMEEEP